MPVVLGISPAVTFVGGARGYLAEQCIGEEMGRPGQEGVATMAESKDYEVPQPVALFRPQA